MRIISLLRAVYNNNTVRSWFGTVVGWFCLHVVLGSVFWDEHWYQHLGEWTWWERAILFVGVVFAGAIGSNRATRKEPEGGVVEQKE